MSDSGRVKCELNRRRRSSVNNPFYTHSPRARQHCRAHTATVRTLRPFPVIITNAVRSRRLTQPDAASLATAPSKVSQRRAMQHAESSHPEHRPNTTPSTGHTASHRLPGPTSRASAADDTLRRGGSVLSWGQCGTVQRGVSQFLHVHPITFSYGHPAMSADLDCGRARMLVAVPAR